MNAATLAHSRVPNGSVKPRSRQDNHVGWIEWNVQQAQQPEHLQHPQSLRMMMASETANASEREVSPSVAEKADN